jgi:hypothetical protein
VRSWLRKCVAKNRAKPCISPVPLHEATMRLFTVLRNNSNTLNLSTLNLNSSLRGQTQAIHSQGSVPGPSIPVLSALCVSSTSPRPSVSWRVSPVPGHQSQACLLFMPPVPGRQSQACPLSSIFGIAPASFPNN